MTEYFTNLILLLNEYILLCVCVCVCCGIRHLHVRVGVGVGVCAMTRPKVGSHLDYSCRPCHYPPCVCIAPRAHLSPHPLPISLPLSLSPSLPPRLLHGIAEAQLYFQFKSIERYTNCVKLAASINPDPGADQVQAWVNGGDGGDPMPLEELIAKCTERVTIAEKGIKYITKNVTAVVAAYEKQQNAVQKLAKTMQVRVRERKRERERERERERTCHRYSKEIELYSTL